MNVTAVIDTETTGLVVGVHEILEFTVVFFDEELDPTGDSFSSFIHPQKPYTIDQRAIDVNGIDWKSISPVLTPQLVRMSFIEWKNSVIGSNKICPLGHNYNFDQRFLVSLLTQDVYDNNFHYRYEDTHVLAVALKRKGKLPPELSASLSSLCTFFGIERCKKHSSEEDCKITLQIYRSMLELI